MSAGTQPDWYIGFADGALRLVPPHLESVFWDHTWSWNIILPVTVLLVFLVLVAIYPFIEAWVTGDKREHHIAQRPRNAATRTAIGAAGVTFYAVLWAAASSDLIATHFMLTIEGVIHALQALLILGPIIAYFVTKRVALGLQKKDREIALHGYESGRIVRLPAASTSRSISPSTSMSAGSSSVSRRSSRSLCVPTLRAAFRWHQHLRAGLSRWFFEDRLAPLTQAQIEDAVAHQHHELTHLDHAEAAEVADNEKRALEDGHAVVETFQKAEVELPAPHGLAERNETTASRRPRSPRTSRTTPTATRPRAETLRRAPRSRFRGRRSRCRCVTGP